MHFVTIYYAPAVFKGCPGLTYTTWTKPWSFSCTRDKSGWAGTWVMDHPIVREGRVTYVVQICLRTLLLPLYTSLVPLWEEAATLTFARFLFLATHDKEKRKVEHTFLSGI